MNIKPANINNSNKNSSTIQVTTQQYRSPSQNSLKGQTITQNKNVLQPLTLPSQQQQQQSQQQQLQSQFVKFQPQTTKNNRQLPEPGLYFDKDQEFEYKKYEKSLQINNNINNKFPQINGNKSPFQNSQKYQKLFGPHEYVQYCTKVGNSKQNYINSLQQLGFDNAQSLNVKSFNAILNKTNNLINKSYSVKYIGVIDNNMGILSRRLKLENNLANDNNALKGSKLMNNELQVSSNNPDDAGKTQNYKQLLLEISSINQNQQNQQNLIQNIQQQSQQQFSEDTQNNIGQFHLQSLQPSYQTTHVSPQMNVLQENIFENNDQFSQFQNQLPDINNKQLEIADYQQKTQMGNQQQQQQQQQQLQRINEDDVTPKPELYNNYVVSQYSLPKNLKPLKKAKDPESQKIKNQLDIFHSQKLKGYVSSNHQTTENEMQQQIEIQRSLKKMNKKGKVGWRKPSKFDDQLDAGFIYNQNANNNTNDNQIVSYSRLLNKLDQEQSAFNIQIQSQLTLKQNTNTQNLQSLEYTLNQDQYDRYEKIKQKNQLVIF